LVGGSAEQPVRHLERRERRGAKRDSHLNYPKETPNLGNSAIFPTIVIYKRKARYVMKWMREQKCG